MKRLLLRLSVGSVSGRGCRLSSSFCSPLNDDEKPIPYQLSAAEFLGHAARLNYQNRKRRAGPTVTAAEDFRPVSPSAQIAIALQNQMIAVLEASDQPLSLIEKSERLLELFAQIKEQRLPMTPSICEAISSTWLATVEPSPSLNEEGGRGPSSPGSLRYLEHMIQLHLYMCAEFVSPTPVSLENLMRALATETSAKGPTERLMHLACRIMATHREFVILPTHITYSCFFDLCAANRLMDLAVVYFLEAQETYFIQPDCGMCRAMIAGFTKTGHLDDAITFIARIKNLPAIDTAFLEVIVETFVYSDEPFSAFSVYRSIFGQERRLTPTAKIFTLLLMACQRTEIWEPVSFILAEMQRYGTKGDAFCLNSVLKGLLMDSKTDYARLLSTAMIQRGVKIWTSLEEPLRIILRSRKIHNVRNLRQISDAMMSDRTGKSTNKRNFRLRSR